MKVAYLVVFDIPHAAPEPTADQREKVRAILADVVRKNTDADTEVAVFNHDLTPAQTAALP